MCWRITRQIFRGGTEVSAPDGAKESKFEIVERLTQEGKSVKEIEEITGFTKNLIYQYRYKINHREQESQEPQEVQPGHNADRHLCQTCFYRGKRNNANGIGCEYALYHEHTRGCSVDDCNVYKKGDPEKTVKPMTL